jgi:hypothetical protein
MGVSVMLLLAALFVGVLLTRYGTVLLPWSRQAAINLEARPRPRGAEDAEDQERRDPAVWLVAHLDSKSQTISMRVRVAAIVLCVLAWIVLLLLWGARAVAPVAPLTMAAIAALATVAALPLAFCRVGSEGDGALDNASGVATVLGALPYLAPETAVGVVIPSAEELGLAGARAWVAGRAPGVAINCDGVDDGGPVVCMLSSPSEYQFRDLFRRAGMQSGEEILVRPLVPGVLVDAVAFKDARWMAITISRGTWRSLARVHTRGDTLSEMDGTGIDRTARFIARLADALAMEGRSATRGSRQMTL